MKKYLMTAAALALLTTTASASELITFYKGTYWQTWVVAADEFGNKMCGMHIEGKNFRFYVKWDVLAGMALQVWKSNWKFAANSVVPFEVKFHDNAKPDDDWSIAIEAGEVRSNSSSVFMAIRTEDQSSLLNAFAEADAGMITFPRPATNSLGYCAWRAAAGPRRSLCAASTFSSRRPRPRSRPRRPHDEPTSSRLRRLAPTRRTRAGSGATAAFKTAVDIAF